MATEHDVKDATPVVIVGGGIAGLATARAMLNHDIAVRVLERRSDSSSEGFAVNLPGNAVKALASLGLGDAIERCGHPLRRREYRTDSDRLLFAVDEDAFWGEAARPRSIRRATLVDMLRGCLGADVVRYGADVRSLSVDEDQAKVALVDGETLTARLVVAADGVGSGVRKCLFGDDAGVRHSIISKSSWRFVAPNPGIDCWTVWAGARGVILLMPLEGGEVYGWASATRDGATASTDALVALSESFPTRVRQAVAAAAAEPGAILHSPLEEVRLPAWSRGRAVLVGDAAHATAPVWAQGVALALEDAIVLAACLSSSSDDAAALAVFEARRRARVDHVQKMTDAMSKAAKLPVLVRNLLMPVVGPKRYRQTYGPLRTEV